MEMDQKWRTKTVLKDFIGLIYNIFKFLEMNKKWHAKTVLDGLIGLSFNILNSWKLTKNGQTSQFKCFTGMILNVLMFLEINCCLWIRQ